MFCFVAGSAAPDADRHVQIEAERSAAPRPVQIEAVATPQIEKTRKRQEERQEGTPPTIR